jgi:hypothetical protein
MRISFVSLSIAAVLGCGPTSMAVGPTTDATNTSSEPEEIASDTREEEAATDHGALDRLVAGCDGSACTLEVRVNLAERLLDRAGSDAASPDRGRAIAILSEVADDRTVPPSPPVEHALSVLLFLWSDSGDAGALAIAERITRDAPGRPVAAEAWLFLGERAFEAGDLGAARAAYAAVNAIAGVEPRILCYAQYKLAWVLLNLSEFEAAFDAFVDVARHGEGALVREARRDALSALLPLRRPGAEEVAAIRQLGGDQDDTIELVGRYEQLLRDVGSTDRADAFRAACAAP